jgi:hypothetical protein
MLFLLNPHVYCHSRPHTHPHPQSLHQHVWARQAPPPASSPAHVAPTCPCLPHPHSPLPSYSPKLYFRLTLQFLIDPSIFFLSRPCPPHPHPYLVLILPTHLLTTSSSSSVPHPDHFCVLFMSTLRSLPARFNIPVPSLVFIISTSSLHPQFHLTLSLSSSHSCSNQIPVLLTCISSSAQRLKRTCDFIGNVPGRQGPLIRFQGSGALKSGFQALKRTRDSIGEVLGRQGFHFRVQGSEALKLGFQPYSIPVISLGRYWRRSPWLQSMSTTVPMQSVSLSRLWICAPPLGCHHSVTMCCRTAVWQHSSKPKRNRGQTSEG